MPNRITKLEDKLVEKGFDAYIVARPQNIRYYTGSVGGSFLFVTPDSDPILLVTVLDENVARDQSRDCHIELFAQEGLLHWFADLLRGEHCRSVGFDDLSLSVVERVGMRLPEIGFKQDQDVVWAQRIVKDAGEVKLMGEAGRLADVAMEALWGKLAVGVTEHQLAAEASYAMMMGGAEAHAFEFTVGSGPRSAYPHASSTGRKISAGDLIVVDIGVSYQGYCSDITRTFMAGKPEGKRAELYDTVLRSHDASFASMKSGISCREVDAISRRVIENAGYGSNYTHSLGHGVGLEIHEPPSVSQRSNETLLAGNVVSNEPGIYLHGFGGVRIEDTVFITRSGPRRLTDFPREIDKATF
ncbi:MAG: Xaa-Pro peptidase family protein [Candidatus Bathyarchaeia archaeon]|jgi:Xaa-Pro dipeptidase